MNLQSVTEYLRGIPLTEFVPAIQTILAAHPTGTSEPGSTADHFFLGIARQKLEGSPGYTVEAVGSANPVHYGDTLGPDWGLAQSATCRACTTTVRSNVKHALCPICGREIYLT